MEFMRRAEGSPSRLGILPGAFNPPTRAHLELARAALAEVEEVVFVLPRAFPHKQYEGASFEQRIAMLLAAAAGPRFSVAVSEGGLFIEIARECRQAYGPGVELWFITGTDAAERIVNWDYGAGGGIDEQLREYGLLVAPRAAVYAAPERLRARVRALDMPDEWRSVSATEVRERICRGERWEHLVPEALRGLVCEIYAGKRV